MDERNLVERVLRGDEGARTEFYQAYRQKLYSYCVYLMGNNDPEIEDILQEAFLTAFQKLSGFEFRSSLDTWLTQICIHKCYRHFRQRGRQVAQADEEMEVLLKPLALDAADQAARVEDQKRQWALVERALGTLGGNCAEILRLRGKGASYIDIARKTKIPIGTVMSRLARCTAALKEEVGRLMEEGKP